MSRTCRETLTHIASSCEINQQLRQVAVTDHEEICLIGNLRTPLRRTRWTDRGGCPEGPRGEGGSGRRTKSSERGV
jgi:hypothetical protein